MSYARRHSTNVCPGNRVRYSVAQEMTREQTAEGDRRASEWKPIDQNQPNESDPVLPT